MNKKAEVPWYVVVFILAILVLIFGTTLLAKTKNLAESSLSPEIFKLDDKSCKSSGKSASENGIEFIDIDHDERPDSCDICVSSEKSDSQYLSNNNLDADLDGMPDYCDENDNDGKPVCSFKLIEKKCVGKN